MKLKLCIFCQKPLQGRYKQGGLTGQTRKTNEHIFPRWLQDELNLRKQPLCIRIVSQTDSRNLVFDKYVTPICRECNQGWLSNLESITKPILKPLIYGTQQQDISLENRRLIASWLFKTAIMLNTASLQQPEGRIVPKEHYVQLYRKNQIPDGVAISIARYSGNNDLFFIQGKRWSSRPGDDLPIEKLNEYFKNSYTITMFVGKLAWRVFYWKKWPEKFGTPPSYDELLAGSIRTVYPIGVKGVLWPPQDSLDSIQLLHESLMIISER